jgi:hypothetical protein
MKESVVAAALKFRAMADLGLSNLSRQNAMNCQWLRLQDPLDSLEIGALPFQKMQFSQTEREPDLSEGDSEYGKKRSQSSPEIGRDSTSSSFSEMVLANSCFLNKIIETVERRACLWNTPVKSLDVYEMSDWEDEDPMIPVDSDINATQVNGKQIPNWACGKTLQMAVSRQIPSDGDILFQALQRRCDLHKIFPNSELPYYRKTVKS